MERQAKTKRKYLQVTYLKKDLCQEYVKKPNSKKRHQAIFKRAKYLSRHLNKKDIQVANKHM